MRYLYLLTAVVVSTGAMAGCGPEELQSTALDRQITVDGDAGDWEGKLRFLDDANLSYGLANDERSLFVVLVVGDRTVRRQIIVSGLYLWFDPEGDENRRFGIRFPIGLEENVADMMPLLREQDPNKLSESFEDVLEEMLVIGPHDETWRRVPVGSVEGIATAAEADRNKLVLEFCVPVTNDGQYGYGVGALPGDVIGLGVETPEIDREDLKERIREARGGGRGGGWGGMGGGRGGLSGSGGRPPRRERPEIPEPIEVWTKVHLADTGASS